VRLVIERKSITMHGNMHVKVLGTLVYSTFNYLTRLVAWLCFT